MHNSEPTSERMKGGRKGAQIECEESTWEREVCVFGDREKLRERIIHIPINTVCQQVGLHLGGGGMI